MKRIAAFLIVLLLSAIVAACGGNYAPQGGDSANQSQGGEIEYKIAISQILEHPSLDATRQGFLDALADAGIVEGQNLKVDYNNAQNDQTNNNSIAQKIAADKNDLVLGIATPSAQALVENVTDGTPVLFAAVTDPLDAGLVDDLEAPGGNVTGASDTNPLAVQQIMDFIAEHIPGVKNVGMVINTGEPNAEVMANNAEQQLAKHDIGLIRAAVTNTSEVQQAAESLVGRVEALFIALDNTVVGGVESIIQVANDNDIPFFASDRDSVEAGAFMTVGFKYYDHGYQAGQMAVEILKNGKNPGEMPVSFPDKIDVILNLKAAEEQGIEVTDAMLDAVSDPENNIIE